MSKVFFLFVLFQMASLSLTSQIRGTFDIAANWSIGLETPGINTRVYFLIGDKICFGPEFSYFFEKSKVDHDETLSTFAFAVDFNAHYLVEIIEHRLAAYPILGLNYTQEKEVEKILQETNIFHKDAFGVNIGVGLELPIKDKLNIFTEYIHTFSSLSDNIFILGVTNEW